LAFHHSSALSMAAWTEEFVGLSTTTIPWSPMPGRSMLSVTGARGSVAGSGTPSIIAWFAFTSAPG